MATVTIRPDGDVIADWYFPIATSHYLNIDDVETYPASPTGDGGVSITGDGYIGGDDNDYDQFTFGNTPSDVDEVTEIKIYIHGSIDNQGTFWNQPEVSYDIGSGFSGDYECTSFPRTTAGVGNAVWHTITLSGLSWTKTQIDAIQVRIRADVPDGTKTVQSFNWVYAMQILVTYTPIATGYAHDFMGVPAANIGSVNGVPTANIASIDGV